SVGAASGIVAMAAANFYLFAATGDGRLLARPVAGDDVPLQPVGRAEGVVAMTAVRDKPFARPPSGALSSPQAACAAGARVSPWRSQEHGGAGGRERPALRGHRRWGAPRARRLRLRGAPGLYRYKSCRARFWTPPNRPGVAFFFVGPRGHGVATKGEDVGGAV